MMRCACVVSVALRPPAAYRSLTGSGGGGEEGRGLEGLEKGSRGRGRDESGKENCRRD